MIRLFGALQAIELPPLGIQLEQDKIGWTFERDHHAASVLSPMSGKVMAVNHKVLEHPQIPHEDPYHQGWLMILDPLYPKRNLRGLYYGKESIHWIEKENQKLLSLMGLEYESLAATGGEPVGDVFAQFPEIGWDHLVHTFLRTEEK
jgi:glycine cleavage system H lipoate-binding protein